MITPEQLANSGTEDGNQAALFLWAVSVRDKYPMLAYMHAIPNGGARNPATAARMKATGVKPGVPDIFLPYPRFAEQRTSQHATERRWFHGLYLELKRPATVGKRAGVTSDKQDEFISWLRSQNYVVAVCYSWIEARDAIEAYLNGSLTMQQ